MVVSTSHIHTHKCHVAKIRYVCRELNPNSQPLKKQKNREKHTPKKKTITCTRQYLRGSAICLRPRNCRDFTIIREEYKSAATVFPLSQKHSNNTTNPNHQ